MEWDIKYHSTSNSIDQIIEKSNKLNSEIDSKHIIENNYVHWQNNQLENNQLKNELIEIIEEDPIHESSTSANKHKHDEILLDTDNK
ncbi:10296_t:CDS:2, partial [Gigaspora rosea]